MKRICQRLLSPSIHLLLLVFSLTLMAAGTPYAATPGPGLATMDAQWNETITLAVNTTPRTGHQPVHQWLLAATSKDDSLYLLTQEGLLLFSADMDLTAYTYPFAAQPAVQTIGDIKLRDLGLVPGDQLYYAYAYAPQADLKTIIIDNIVTLDITAADVSLTPFGSDLELADYLKQGMLDANTYFGPVMVGTGAEDNAGGSTSSFSVTNLQEAGVDEADVIKSDGTYLYIAPTDQTGDWFIAAPGKSQEKKDIRIMALSESPAQATEAGTLSLADHTQPVDGLYLVTGRDGGNPDLLITIGGSAQGWGLYWADSWYWQQGETEIGIYTLDLPAQPSKSVLITLEGSLIASRRVDDTLYLVTRFTPGPSGFLPYATDTKETQNNQAVLDNVTAEDLLPGWSRDGTVQGNLVGPGDCFLAPYDPSKPAQPDIITITAVPLADPDGLISKSVAGPTETVYVSSQSLFLATTRYDYAATTTGGVVGAAVLPAASLVETDIHQFDLGGDTINYRGSGTVLGNLGWETDKRPFRFSQYDGVLRVATSEGDTWDMTAATRLTLLKPQDTDADGGDSGAGTGETGDTDSGKTLEILSYISGIGEAGERLYAVRYQGPKAYLVTFRSTDPLYVFDLSDPEAPQQLGELHMDGYADYLHPVGEDLLLGIGKDAVPDVDSGDFEGSFAWYQGVKLSLFDVSDPQNPTEITKIVLGKRGSESDALYDHHAVTYLPPTDTTPARLAIPVQLHDTEPAGYDISAGEPWTYYDWTRTGLYLFDIYTGEQDGYDAGMTARGSLIAADSAGGDAQDYGYYSWSGRSLILGDSVHYVHNDQVWSALWDAPDAPAGPQ